MKKKTRKHSTYPKCVDATHILCFYISILFLKRSGWLWIKISSVFAPFVWVFFSYFFLFHIVLPNAIRSKNVHCVGFHFSLLSTPYYQMCEVCILKHITRKKKRWKKIKFNFSSLSYLWTHIFLKFLLSVCLNYFTRVHSPSFSYSFCFYLLFGLFSKILMFFCDYCINIIFFFCLHINGNQWIQISIFCTS